MISEVVMPQMGADMTEGTIVRWLKREGDAVERGEIIAEIETDKANVEIEAFEGGVFRAEIAHEGDTVPVGKVIAVVAAQDDDISQYVNGASGGLASTNGAAPPPPTPAAERPPAPSAPATAEPRPASTGSRAPGAANAPAGRLRASPVARRMADELGVDIRRVRGTGPDGRIVKRDVEAARAAAAPEPRIARPNAATPQPTRAPAPGAGIGEARAVTPSKMRQAIARRMAQSKREAPHYYLLIDIDMTDALALREQVNAAVEDDGRVSINDLIVRACAMALQRHPQFNATIEGEQATVHERQHICIGIAVDDGLIAPAILDAGTKPLTQIAAGAKDLIARAKGGSLRPDEITAGTFTISNLGAYGVETLVAIIQPPQTAILGAGAVAPQAAVRDGQVVVRSMMKVALSADHRVTDGAQGAQFLGEIRRLLEQPVLLVL